MPLINAFAMLGMSVPDYMPELFVSLSQRFGLILAGGFAIMTLTPVSKYGFEREPSTRLKILQIMLFGLFGILGTYTGNQVFQSYANLRAMGVITAGLFGGPLLGVGAGLIAGGHRYLIDVGGFSALPCAVSTLLEGVAAGLLSHRLKGRSLDWRLAFGLGLAGETVHMLLVLALSRPYADAVALVQLIGLPMIVVNSIGAAIFVESLAMQLRFRDRRDSIQVQQIMEIANRTVGHLRSGLNAASAEATARIIFDLVPVAAVGITGGEEVLAHIGAGADHHVAGRGVRTEATRRVLETGEPEFLTGNDSIACEQAGCPLSFAAIVPLRKGPEIVGCLKLYGTRREPLDHMRFELAKGLGDLFSTQLELEDIQIKNQLLAHAEIRRLQAQINPHFLFNSLNTIASFCRTAPQQARELLLDLAHYMRQSVDLSRGFVPLEDELSRIRSYLSIEQARFGDRVRAEVEVEDDLSDWPVPPLILQPLVENSVKHGILGREEGGVVRLIARRENGHLHVCVSDDGVGMEAERVEALLAPVALESTAEGVGVRNCNQRLVQLYGPEHHLEIDSRPGFGASICLRIPRVDPR